MLQRAPFNENGTRATLQPLRQPAMGFVRNLSLYLSLKVS